MLCASMKERWTEDKEVERVALAALVDGGGGMVGDRKSVV